VWRDQSAIGRDFSLIKGLRLFSLSFMDYEAAACTDN
jgi:hypothetical protein